MGLLDWFVKPSSAEGTDFCSKDFPKLWTEFVSSFVDSGFNGSAVAPPPEAAVQEVPTVVPAAERLVAIGDLHGDYDKAVRAFKVAGLVDDKGRWCGGNTVAVQVGDILDRGDDEIRIFYFLERLQREATAAGGKLYVLNGNHETMNVMANHRYATAGAHDELLRWQQWQALGVRLRAHCGCSSVLDALQPTPAQQAVIEESRASRASGSIHFTRTASMQPGSPLTRRFMANHPIVLQVGSTVFVHGGVLPRHVEYGLENINKECQEWMHRGSMRDPPGFLRGASAIVWARDYSAEDEARCDCDKLQQVLQAIPGAQRMVMGHTIQRPPQGINAACDGKAYRIDVGMSSGCGDHPVQALEILNDSKINRLREGLPPEDLNGQTSSATAAAVGAAAAAVAVAAATAAAVSTAAA